MNRYILLLKYNGRLDVPDEKDNRDQTVIDELQDLLQTGQIQYDGYHHDEGFDMDNCEEDCGEPLFGDETLIEVRLDIDIDITTLQDDAHQKMLDHVSSVLNNKSVHISNCHEREYENFIKTIIEVTVIDNANQ